MCQSILCISYKEHVVVYANTNIFQGHSSSSKCTAKVNEGWYYITLLYNLQNTSMYIHYFYILFCGVLQIDDQEIYDYKLLDTSLDDCKLNFVYNISRVKNSAYLA